jgi:hypothetical protein
VEYLDCQRVKDDFLLDAVPAPDLYGKGTALCPHLGFKDAYRLLELSVSRDCRDENEFAKRRNELFRFLDFGAKLLFGDPAAIVGVLAFALDADLRSRPATPSSENIDAVLPLAGDTIVLHGGVVQRKLKQQPRVALKRRPVFRRGYRY